MKYKVVLPAKNTKPISPVYGKQLGFRCPVCIGKKGFKVKSAFSGGSACPFCDGGRILNKKKYYECFEIKVKIAE